MAGSRIPGSTRQQSLDAGTSVLSRSPAQGSTGGAHDAAQAKPDYMSRLHVNVSATGRPTYAVPNVNKRKYRFADFGIGKVQFTPRNSDGGAPAGGQPRQVDVALLIQAAWRRIIAQAARKECNDYFLTLARKKGLKDVLAEGDIVVHCLVPKEGFDWDDLPAANTAGRDIGINPALLTDPDDIDGLACTLIHELAHVAGASTNSAREDQGSLDAEQALSFCGCKRLYDKENRGSIEPLRRNHGTRIV